MHTVYTRTNSCTYTQRTQRQRRGKKEHRHTNGWRWAAIKTYTSIIELKWITMFRACIHTAMWSTASALFGVRSTTLIPRRARLAVARLRRARARPPSPPPAHSFHLGSVSVVHIIVSFPLIRVCTVRHSSGAHSFALQYYPGAGRICMPLSKTNCHNIFYSSRIRISGLTYSIFAWFSDSTQCEWILYAYDSSH